jgi:hypothetical protein
MMERKPRMALLVDALRASETGTASARAPDGTLVTVQRVIGREEPYSQESYTVRTQHGAAPPKDRFAAEHLLEAIQRMQRLGLTGFDPEFYGWQPAVGQPAVDPDADTHAP